MPSHLITMPDPRQQPVAPTSFYLTFRHQLAASEHVRVLAQMIRNVSLLFEGNLREPHPDVEPRYLKAAELVVRYTSEESRIGAEQAMEDYAVQAFDDLEQRLRSVDCDRAMRRSAIIEHVRNANSVYVGRLKNGAIRQPLEWEQFDANEARDAGL